MVLTISMLVLLFAGVAWWIAWEVARGRRWDREFSLELAAFLARTEEDSEETVWLPAISISDALSLEVRQRINRAQHTARQT
jgi:hypothetical protein